MTIVQSIHIDHASARPDTQKQVGEFDPSEREQLDQLLGMALFDPILKERLLSGPSCDYLRQFGLSERLCSWLSRLESPTLIQLARSIAYHP
jgi:hypothetical protein